ncbi:TPA: hypothetical protein DCZ15_03080 [Candidatus Falkowbacteria bacterium]|nr:MAG: hypothetical protein UV95_C0002G0002 [Candidatus Falkowbacteria bacterium GW2011_GWF2_43_32]HBA36832.1 hypothetical protein [Candidatus Falkowbacteria bacterium]
MEQIGQTIKASPRRQGNYGRSTMKNFTIAPNWLLKSPKYTRNERIIAIALNSFAFGKKECWPSQETIAERAKLCLTSTKETIKSLVKKGLIEKMRDGKHRSICYKLNY